MVRWIVSVLVVIECIFSSSSSCSSVDILNEAIIQCPESFVFKEAIFLPPWLRNSFPLIFQSIPILYL